MSAVWLRVVARARAEDGVRESRARLLRDEHLVLFGGPRVLADGRVELVVPPLATLLAIPSRQILGNLGPAVGAIHAALLSDEAPHGVVLLLRPRALRKHAVGIRWGTEEDNKELTEVESMAHTELLKIGNMLNQAINIEQVKMLQAQNQKLQVQDQKIQHIENLLTAR